MWSFLSICIIVVSWTAGITEAIVGGDDAKPYQFPYAVAIMDEASPDDVICSGVILDEDTILTLASCTSRIDHVLVYCGDIHLTNQSSDNRYAVGSQIYNLHSSLVILKLAKLLNFTDENLGAIALPQNDPPEGVDMILMGWGSTNGNSETSANTLQYLSLTTISNEECRATWSDLPSSQFCSVHDNSVGPCSNDLGAPLVTNGTLYGILLQTEDECVGKDPNIFVNITDQLDWIEGFINN